jgi:drug/metabolite transporter (DMT)-like permease
MQSHARKTSLGEGVAAGFLFGTAAIFVRFLSDLNGFSIVFWRALIACFVMVLVLLLLRKPFDLGLVVQNLKQLFVLGFLLALHLMLFVLAVKDTTILDATVLVNTTPFFSMLVSSFIFKMKPSSGQFVGLSVSFVGVCTIALAASQAAHRGSFSPNLKGDAEALLAAVVEAFYLSYGKGLRNQMNIFSLMLPIYALTAIVAGMTSLFAGTTVLALSSQEGTVLPLLGLGVLPTAVAHTLYFSSLSNLKSFETATMALLEPMGATLLGVLLFREVPTPVFVLGAAIVSVGIIFIGRSSNQGRVRSNWAGRGKQQNRCSLSDRKPRRLSVLPE